MRVLHVYKDYAPVLGGIEGHLRLLAETQAARGLDVTVLVTSRDRNTSISREGGVRLIRAARIAEVAATPISTELIAHLRRARVDLVHVHMPYPVAEIAELLFGAGRPCVVTYHSDVVRQRVWAHLLAPLRRRFLRRSARILVTSSAYLRSSPFLGPFRDKCRVVPLGVDIERFANAAAEAAAAAEDGGDVRERGSAILFVGRFRHYKGLSVLIDAMSRVESTLTLVGDGPMRRRVERQVRSSPAAARIELAGEVSDADLPGYYARADVVVLPSTQRSEAFGLTLVEAMAAAKPVLSTELGTGTSEVNQHGVTGLVVPPGDAAALARGLRELLGDPTRRRQMGLAAAKRVRERYGVARMVDATLDTYRAVCGPSRE